jgi:hypothetical protein
LLTIINSIFSGRDGNKTDKAFSLLKLTTTTETFELSVTIGLKINTV